MRVLTKAEQNEFNKTYDFLNCYVGMACNYGAKKATQIRINGALVNRELIDFVNAIEKLEYFEELDFVSYEFSKLTGLEKINRIFNDTTKERKQLAMNRLVRYCFNKKVQPYRLRHVGEIKDYFVAEISAPISIEYAS